MKEINGGGLASFRNMEQTSGGIKPFWWNPKEIGCICLDSVMLDLPETPTENHEGPTLIDDVFGFHEVD